MYVSQQRVNLSPTHTRLPVNRSAHTCSRLTSQQPDSLVSDHILDNLRWPWMTLNLNGQKALCRRKDASFGAYCTDLNEDRHKLSAAKMQANDSSFWTYRVHVDIRGGFLLAGSSNESGVVNDSNDNFWQFRWLPFRKFQQYYMTIC